ncbi:MAG: sigma-70 family RNA polymerase sigma factor [Pirellulales bacterium]|nr:sigma-70 family RNA polymerase sigma factor [Pirellulales bacterium]
MPPVDAMLIAEMFDRHAAALALYDSQWTTSADDCVQEALVELARQRTRPDNPAAWLYRVVRNRALNALRASRRRTAHEEAAAARPRHAPSDVADQQAQIELKDALESLEPDAREIVVLRIWGGLAWEEIAAVVGGSRSGAQRHYVRALEQLRHLWEPRSCPTK